MNIFDNQITVYLIILNKIYKSKKKITFIYKNGSYQYDLYVYQFSNGKKDADANHKNLNPEWLELKLT